jgi:GGDEF domain-containing protein
VQEVSVPHILDNDPAALELFYDEVGNQSDVEQVFLVGPHRWLLASGGNVDQEFLSFVADPLIERVLATGERHQVYDSHILSIAAPVFVGTRLIGVLRLDYCQKELLAKMQTVLVSNLFAGFIFLLAGLIFSRWAAARLSSPLMQLKDAARKAADGNLDTELKLQTNDEFSQVGEAFNTMMANMRTSMHEIHRVAYEDKLTGVPNRSWLNNQLEHLVLHHTKSETGFAVMFLDLDKFKAVNDTHGHHVGDLLLRAFSRRVARCMREERLKVRGVATDDRLPDMGAGEGVLARLGGDEFLLIVPTAKAEDLAERLVWAMSKPFKLEGCLSQQFHQHRHCALPAPRHQPRAPSEVCRCRHVPSQAWRPENLSLLRPFQPRQNDGAFLLGARSGKGHRRRRFPYGAAAAIRGQHRQGGWC